MSQHVTYVAGSDHCPIAHEIFEVPEHTELLPAMPGIERRVARRKPVRWTGSYQRLDRQVKAVEIHDISLAGVGFSSAVCLKVGERVYLQWEFMYCKKVCTVDAIVKIKNVVLSNNKFRCGAVVVKISEANRGKLASFLSD